MTIRLTALLAAAALACMSAPAGASGSTVWPAIVVSSTVA